MCYYIYSITVVAIIDVQNGADVFKKINTPVLGIIENMSYFHSAAIVKDQNNNLVNGTIQTDNRHYNVTDGKVDMEFEIFKGFGGKSESQRLNVPLLGNIPLTSNIVESADIGEPYVLKYEKSSVTKIFNNITRNIIKHNHIV